jgi:hypothetical protein
MPAQAGTQFFALRCEIRWVPACAGMTESTHSSFNPEVISGLILRTNDDFAAFDQEVKDFDNVLVSHSHTAGGFRFAD